MQGEGVVANKEVSSRRERLAVALDSIDGLHLERELIELARIGGTPIDALDEVDPVTGVKFYQSERYSVGRVALTPTDVEARRYFVKPRLEELGMYVHEHPMGLVGVLEGSNPELEPLLVMSHTDSVPAGDMYDGTTGVIGAVEAVKALQEAGLKPERDIYIVSFTGEESSGYGMALFGSRDMFHGLTESELNAHKKDGPIDGDKTIKHMLEARGIADEVGKFFGNEIGQLRTPGYALEAHVEQFYYLDLLGVDVGVVEAIAAPNRFAVEIPSKPGPDRALHYRTKHIGISVNGEVGHSGATPMDDTIRADGLLKSAELLDYLADWVEDKGYQGCVQFGGFEIEGSPAINKIPGNTKLNLRIVAGNSLKTVTNPDTIQKELVGAVNKFAAIQDEVDNRFSSISFNVEELTEGADTYSANDRNMSYVKNVAGFIGAVNEVANEFADQGVVATVGTFSIGPDGTANIGLDVRGREYDSRQVAISEIQSRTGVILPEASPGATDPIELDPELADRLFRSIGSHAISVIKMDSPAGHDAQNAAAAGIPTALLFGQSNRGGKAHNPEAYTHPDRLKSLVQAITISIHELATWIDEQDKGFNN